MNKKETLKSSIVEYFANVVTSEEALSEAGISSPIAEEILSLAQIEWDEADAEDDEKLNNIIEVTTDKILSL